MRTLELVVAGLLNLACLFLLGVSLWNKNAEHFAYLTLLWWASYIGFVFLVREDDKRKQRK